MIWPAASATGAAAAFFAAYVAVTGLSLPGAALLTLAAGALFGLLWGTIIVSFASSIGATLAFLAARFVLRDWVQARYGSQLQAINRGVEKEGAFYLFTLRLIPAVPFFVINLAMGLTSLRTGTFYWVSQLGMLAGTIVYVYAGTQLGRIGSLGDVLSPGLIGAFLALGFFPLLAKRAMDAYRARRVYRRWQRPARFDRNLVVIGAGSAGLVSAYIASAVRAKVTLIEKHRMGGDCLNTGCVPSKALLRSAKLVWQLRQAHKYGIVGVEDARAKSSRITQMIEKPKPGMAPSNLHISGRYILQPEIFELLGAGERGAGGEIQITDAMIRLAKTRPFYAFRFDGTIYDCGSRIGFLAANVAYALARSDLAPALRAEIKKLLSGRRAD